MTGVTRAWHTPTRQALGYNALGFGNNLKMKVMQCKDLGGVCDQKLSAETWNEMVQAMLHHVLEKHPDVAKQMERMHKEDPNKWGRENKPKWDAAPEVVTAR